MLETSTTRVRNCSEAELFSLCFYLYQIVNDLREMESHEETQTLYNSLVEKLNLEKHSEKIIDAFVNKQIKLRRLTPMENMRHDHPFEMRGDLKLQYREDRLIYENCGNWSSKNQRDVNLCRCVFSPNDNNFSKIIAMTFFMEPEQLEKNNYKIPSNIPIPSKIKKALADLSTVKFAKDCLKLSDAEAELLQLAYRLKNIKEIYDVCNDLYRNNDLPRQEIFAKCLNTPVKNVRLLLKKDQKLRAYGFINDEGFMDEAAVDAISEKDLKYYFTDIIKTEKNNKSYELDSFSVKQDKTNLAVQFLKSSNSCNILLYGAPGAGKTQYAKALINAAGLKMTTYKNEIEITGKDEDANEVKALERLNCYLSLKKEDSILVVDEAETVLKTIGSFFGMRYSLPQKGTVNKMLENSENKVIWILNYTDELDESTLRRFTYSIRFHEMPKSILRSIAEKKFEDVKLSKNLKTEIIDICGKYQITGASVENIVKAVKSMDCSKGSDEKIIKDVKNVLEANSSLLFGKKKMRESVKDNYNLDVLNTTTPAKDLVEMVENAVIDREDHPDNPEGIRMLFYGLSGTGKTQLARYLSERLGKRLLLKRASDIMDKYVGESEQRIKEAFEEAEETDSILLFDEADTFFADRTTATQSWERAIVNEFLTQMEEFNGILICTTNLRKIMDPALQRRFHILTEFKPLTDSGIRTLLECYFGKYSFNNEQLETLVHYDSVTPGDFGTLNSKLRFVAKDKISSSYIVQELKNIQAEKKINGGGKIGFAS